MKEEMTVVLIAVSVPKEDIDEIKENLHDTGDEIFRHATALDFREGLWEIPYSKWCELEDLVTKFYLEMQKP